LDFSGPVIDRVLVIPLIRADIDGITGSLQQSSDIGAREYPKISKTPYSGRGALTKNLFFPEAVTQVTDVMVLILRQRKGKVKKSGICFFKSRKSG
jgi:hypothetical protein